MVTAGWAAAMGALIGLMALVSHTLLSRRALLTQTRLTLARLESPEARELRRTAARKLLCPERGNPELASVLNLFDRIAVLLERGAIHKKLTMQGLAWPVVSYWVAAKDLIADERTRDPGAWVSLEALVYKLLPQCTCLIFEPAKVRAYLEQEARDEAHAEPAGVGHGARERAAQELKTLSEPTGM